MRSAEFSWHICITLSLTKSKYPLLFNIYTGAYTCTRIENHSPQIFARISNVFRCLCTTSALPNRGSMDMLAVSFNRAEVRKRHRASVRLLIFAKHLINLMFERWERHEAENDCRAHLLLATIQFYLLHFLHVAWDTRCVAAAATKKTFARSSFSLRLPDAL